MTAHEAAKNSMGALCITLPALVASAPAADLVLETTFWFVSATRVVAAPLFRIATLGAVVIRMGMYVTSAGPRVRVLKKWLSTSLPPKPWVQIADVVPKS